MHQDIDWSLGETDHVDFHGIWELDVDFQRLADADYLYVGLLRWSSGDVDPSLGKQIVSGQDRSYLIADRPLINLDVAGTNVSDRYRHWR